MEHGSTLFHDLTIISVCAAIVAFIFSRLKISLILGYLLCGLVLGPHLFYKSPILSESSVSDLGGLGVIFLMFYIGLEFDLSKLKTMLGSALPAVLLQTVVMMFVGLLTAPLFGWSSINGFFMGSILAISSTMVTFSVMRDQGATKLAHGQLAVGILILEDIVAIMLLVLLSGVAVNGEFAWHELGETTFVVLIFVMTVFVLGKLLAPGLLRSLQKMDSLEVVLLVTLGLLLGVGFLALDFKFEPALGAFLAGAILSHSILSEQIEKLTEPFRFLFSAIFFVTVGMQIDLGVIFGEWGSILLVSVLVIVGKMITCWLGLAMSGQSARSSFRAAIAKAQIGEFSFIIAALGQSLGVVDPRLSSITVGAALLTILATPIFSKHSDSIFDWLANRTPETAKQFGIFYKGLLQTISEHFDGSTWLNLVQRPLLQIVGYFLLFNGTLFATALVAQHLGAMGEIYGWMDIIRSSVWIAGGIFCLPFLIAVIRNLDAILLILTEATFTHAGSERVLGSRMSQIFHSVLLGFVLVLFGGIYLSAATDYFPSGVSLIGFALLLIAVGFGFWKKIVKINSRLENLFIESLEKEVRSFDEVRLQAMLEKIAEKYPWPLNLLEIIINDQCASVGQRLMDLRLREKSGATVIAIGRGGLIHYAPEPELPLFPGDHIFVTGEANQNEEAQRLLTTHSLPGEAKVMTIGEGFHLEKIFLTPDAPWIGQTLAETNLRRLYGVSVVGIQREEQRISSPSAEELLHAGDLLLVVGDPKSITSLKSAMQGA
jgi:monovalent cation:H+ antiporter-2, CPA2 family